MEEKIKVLRQRLIKELENIKEGEHILLTEYDPEVLELILFCDNINYRLLVDEYGRKKYILKKFALPLKALKKIDFSNVSFDLFDASGYDFSNLYNVKIHPANMDLSNAKLKGVEFIGSFYNTKITGADFTGSKNAYIGNSLHYEQSKNVNFKPDCYETVPYIDMTNCIFTDATFLFPIKYKRIGSVINLFDEHQENIYLFYKIDGANFEGSRNAKIYPQYLMNGLDNCKLKDATIIGNVYSTINGTDFTGAKSRFLGITKDSVELNPKYISTKNIMDNKNKIDKECVGTKFNGVTFTEAFPRMFIKDVNFTGSKNAIIQLINLVTSNINSINFTDARVIGEDGEDMNILENGRLETKIETKINKTLIKKNINNS